MKLRKLWHEFLLFALILFGTVGISNSVCSGGRRQDDKGGKAFLCYWGSWSVYKREVGDPGNTDASFQVENIDPFLCTHIIYSFAGLNETTNEIESLDRYADYDGYNSIGKLIGLKSVNPNLKVLIAIGGWGQGSERFSIMSADPEKRNIFINSVIAYLDVNGFDDMDWEYPARRGGAPEDKENFVILLQELREAFDNIETPSRDVWLTAALGAGKEIIDEAYDVAGISLYLDCLNIMAYDFKVYVDGEWEMIGHHSPLNAKPWEIDGNSTLTVSHAVEYFIKQGAPSSKLALGIGAYGKTYDTSDLQSYPPEFYDTVYGPGPAFGFSGENGTVAYYEICYYLVYRDQISLGWNFKFDTDYKVPFAYNSTLWMGYDDERSVIEKVDYAEEKGLGGMMIWSIDQDDFKNWCDGWVPNPIGSTIKDRLNYHILNQANKIKITA